MKGFLLFIFICTASGLSAQKKTDSQTIQGDSRFVARISVQAGRDSLNHKDILGTEFLFAGYRESSVIDTVSGMATIQIRDKLPSIDDYGNTGWLIGMQIPAGKVRWVRPIVYPRGVSAVKQTGSFLTYNEEYKTHCLDVFSGQSLWKNSYYFVQYFLKRDYRIGMGYFSMASGYPTQLHGIDLNTGKSLWTRKIPFVQGIDGVTMIDSVHALIQSGGLHQVNLHTGKGWDFAAKTYSAESYPDILPIHAIRGITSNPLITEDAIYFTSRDRVIALNRQGKLRWETMLPSGVACYTNMHHSDSLIYAIGRGVAFVGSDFTTYGQPYIAAYQKQDGAVRFFKTIDERKCRVEVTGFRHDSIVLITADRIHIQHVDGRDEREVVIDTMAYGEVNREINAEQLLHRDPQTGRFSVIVQALDTWALLTIKHKVLLLGDQMDIRESLDVDSLYYCYAKWDNLSMLHRDSITYIVDDNGTLRATLNASQQPTWMGDICFIPTFQGFIKVECKEIFDDRYRQPDTESGRERIAAWTDDRKKK